APAIGKQYHSPFFFNLTMLVNISNHRYVAFGMCLLLFVVIVSANLVIILVISREKSLHEPMYIFIWCLSSDFLKTSCLITHLISRPACFVQIYVIYMYASYDLTLLGIKSWDQTQINHMVIWKLVALAWIYPIFSVAACVYLASTLPLCGNNIHKLFCANWPVVKLLCVSTVINNLVGMLVSCTTVFLPLAFVLYTYVRIFLVCRKCSAQFRDKVIQSCLSHIVTFANYSFTVFCDVALSHFNVEELNPFLAIILSFKFVVIPPILNPLVYGLKLPEIRKLIWRMLSCSKPD
uniref:G-protein coupled receptors family 1 profile domain-containing protein n=1 Tax=Sphaeramia orbicularis TaxID=375764 RepID=A0A673AD05_9TELE